MALEMLSMTKRGKCVEKIKKGKGAAEFGGELNYFKGSSHRTTKKQRRYCVASRFRVGCRKESRDRL